VSLGHGVPTAPLAMPKSPESRKAVGELSAKWNAMLLAGNGVLTLGDDLNQAYLRMELVEHYAKILTTARALGPVEPLPPTDLARLLEARKKAGLGPKK
jgi:L-fuculose-phosphate aldolase